MNTIANLAVAIFLCIVLICVNMVKESCEHPVSIVAINTILLIGIMVFILLYAKGVGEKYDSEAAKKDPFYDYDFSKSDPNVTVNGDLIGGTVYAAYPNQTGGLGWIL